MVIRALIPWPTDSTDPKARLPSYVTLWLEIDENGAHVRQSTLTGNERALEHVIVEFDQDRGTNAHIFLRAIYSSDDSAILRLYDENTLEGATSQFKPVAFLQIRGVQGGVLANSVVSQPSAVSDVDLARQRFFAGLAATTSVNHILSAASTEQPKVGGRRNDQSRYTSRDGGIGHGIHLPVAGMWSLSVTSSLFIDFQTLIGKTAHPELQIDATASFSPQGNDALIMHRCRRFSPASLQHLIWDLEMRSRDNDNGLGCFSRAQARVRGSTELRKVLMVQGRAARFEYPAGVTGVIVVLSSTCSEAQDVEIGGTWEISGVIWMDCCKTSISTERNCQPMALKKCRVSMQGNGFKIDVADVKQCVDTENIQPMAAPAFRDMSEAAISCYWIKSHGTPFGSDTNLKHYLDQRGGYLVAAVWRSSYAGELHYPIPPTSDLKYIPGNFKVAFAQTVVTADILAFESAISASNSF